MRRLQFSSYRQVYGLLLRTYGKSTPVRISFGTALISRTVKFVGLPIAASQLVASLAAQDYNRARVMVLAFALCSLTIGILAPITRYVALLGENVTYSQSMKVYFSNLLQKDIRYFNESMTGYITTATRQYSDNSLNLLRKIRESYMSTVFAMVVPIIVISVADWRLGLLMAGLASVQVVYLLWASQVLGPYRSRAREMYKRVSGSISDAITNIVAIKSTAQEAAFSDKISRDMKHESELFIARYKTQVKLIAVRECITVSFFFVLFWVTVTRIANGSIGVAGAVLVVTYSFTLMTAIYELSDALDEHDDFIDKIVPMFELLQEPNLIKDPGRPKSLGSVQGKIEFKEVSFAYSEGEVLIPVFNQLSFTVPAGQKLGIVGLSGAGKSTLAKLLLRFEDAQSGVIRVDGIQIDKVRQTDLRRQIAYVPQEPLLFHSSIAENIQLARLDATIDEVKAAAEAAYASIFISGLPNDFNSIVGERGVKLSGGQKQRIAIARAVLQDAPIILLDEATSALDSESEQIIKESFATILKNKTAIVIAHRLSTLADMDRIILLHEGSILEDGNHKELLKQKGVYAKLWNRQKLHPEDLEISDKKLTAL